MKFNKDHSRITCGPHKMVALLNLMNDTTTRFQYLLDWDPKCAVPVTDIYVFRSGAKLGRLAKSTWYVYGYQKDHVDQLAAIAELRAADLTRQAINHKRAIDDLLRTPRSQRVDYKGLWGTRVDGSVHPERSFAC